MDLTIYNRIDELNSTIRDAENAKANAIAERESYYYRISLCNSSDSFTEFKTENPNHPLLQYSHVQRPAQSGWLSDVLVRILRCDISKEDFLSFARLVVNPNVGEDDFQHFEYKLKCE